jgi:hypothetical protein
MGCSNRGSLWTRDLDRLCLVSIILLEDLPRASGKGSAARFTGSHLEWEIASDAIERLVCDGHPSGGRCPFWGSFRLSSMDESSVVGCFQQCGESDFARTLQAPGKLL